MENKQHQEVKYLEIWYRSVIDTHSMGPLSVLLSTLSVLLPARAYINPQLDLEKLLRVATRRTALAAGKGTPSGGLAWPV